MWLLACGMAAFGLVGAEQLAKNAAPAPAEEVINFALIDHRGKLHELRRADARAVVLFFTGNGCPMAQQSIVKLRMLQQLYLERGVAIWMVNSNPGDDRASIIKEAET